MTFVKICGITNLEDALTSVDAGADALGFNFYRPSPRYIEPDAARRIIAQLPRQILTVGVFVNEESPAAVEQVASSAGVQAVQLHGDESPAYCETLNNRFVIKAFRVGKDFDPQQVVNYKVPAIMLDGFHPELRGGTGRIANWAIARQTTPLVAKLFLAGGLSPENVAEALAAVSPYAVDACSGLESRPGQKDSDRVREFIRVVRASG